MDLRSDTPTKPTEAMLRAMVQAEVGDSARGECHVTRAFEEELADLAGTEAALFLPTCTMANNIALLYLSNACKAYSFACGRHSHIIRSEDFANKILGLAPALLDVGSGGLPDPESVQRALCDGASFVCLENTTWSRGVAWDAVPSLPCPIHLDGARIWNAEVALQRPLAELCAGAASVALCFSKGLGSPGGAALCASSEAVEEAQIWRRTLGGAMRRAPGQLAAAAAAAFAGRRERLQEDHRRALQLRDGLTKLGGSIANDDAFAAGRATNVVLWRPEGNSREVADCLAKMGIQVRQNSAAVRFVLHGMVGDEDLSRVIEACGLAVEKVCRSGQP